MKEDKMSKRAVAIVIVAILVGLFIKFLTDYGIALTIAMIILVIIVLAIIFMLWGLKK